MSSSCNFRLDPSDLVVGFCLALSSSTFFSLASRISDWPRCRFAADGLQVIGCDGPLVRREPGSSGDGTGARGRVPHLWSSSEVGALAPDLLISV